MDFDGDHVSTIQMFQTVNSIETPKQLNDISIETPQYPVYPRPVTATQKQVQFQGDIKPKAVAPKRLVFKQISEKSEDNNDKKKVSIKAAKKDEKRREKSLELLKELNAKKMSLAVTDLKDSEKVPMKKQQQSNLRKAPLTKFDGDDFYHLEPTLSIDYAPNNQGKVYN